MVENSSTEIDKKRHYIDLKKTGAMYKSLGVAVLKDRFDLICV